MNANALNTVFVCNFHNIIIIKNYKMLGPGSNNGKNPKKSFMKNAYDEIEERGTKITNIDYRELLDAKDLQIRGL